MRGQPNRLGGRIRSGTGDHRHPPPRLLDHHLDHLLVLVMASASPIRRSIRTARCRRCPTRSAIRPGRATRSRPPRRHETGLSIADKAPLNIALSSQLTRRIQFVVADFDLRPLKHFHRLAGHEDVIGAVATLAPFDFEVAAAQFDRRFCARYGQSELPRPAPRMRRCRTRAFRPSRAPTPASSGGHARVGRINSVFTRLGKNG